MNIKYTVVVIGLGKIGMGFDPVDSNTVYSHAKAFSMHGSFELIGAIENNRQLCETFTNRYQLPVFTSVREAMALNPDVVVIAVQTDFHRDVFDEVITTWQPLSILIEKPIMSSAKEAAYLVGTCCERNIALFVNYIRRCDPGVIAVKEKINAGQLGKFNGITWYSKGLTHNGSHFVNLVTYWFGEPTRILMIKNGRSWEDKDPEPTFYLGFKNGSITFIPAWEEKFSYYGIEIISESGRLRYEEGGASIKWQGITVDREFEGYRRLDSQVHNITSSLSNAQLNVADQLARALNGESFELCTGVEGLETLKIIEQIISKRNPLDNE